MDVPHWLIKNIVEINWRTLCSIPKSKLVLDVYMTLLAPKNFRYNFLFSNLGCIYEMVIGVVVCTAMLNDSYVVYVIASTGREGGIGVYGCGRAEEAQQE